MDAKRVVHNIEPEDFTKSSVVITVGYEVLLSKDALKKLTIDRVTGNEIGDNLTNDLLKAYKHLRDNCEEFIEAFDYCIERLK